MTPPLTTATAVLKAPFTRRQCRELLFCLAGLAFVFASPITLFVMAADAMSLVSGVPGNPTVVDMAVACVITAALLVVLVSTFAARKLGSWQRALAARLLAVRVPAPPSPRPARGPRACPGPGPRDAVGWRAIAYLLVRLPVAVAELYVLFFWVGGLFNLGYPLWWGAFRNGSSPGPMPVFTPLGVAGSGTFQVAGRAGTVGAAAAGAVMLLLAPWVSKGVTAADVWLIRGLLGPGRMAQRVRDLELSRALVIDDSAALLRRLERDLHDGAQVRLATLAMNLGMAREKLSDGSEESDAAAARELVDASLRGAKDALGELRSLARGIHPPVLDDGLPEALASLGADSAIPVELEVGIPTRPAPAIEAIAYFCAAELLANAAKHSSARQITIRAVARRDVLTLSVTDDGRGGADPARGTGLLGLAQRVAVVDGDLTVASPPGGPTQVTVELPLRP
ncbi:MAG TPA: sensor domain-containing protein [Solirubrobacterales bacterium]